VDSFPMDDEPMEEEVANVNSVNLLSNDPREYPCQYCDEVFRSRQQRHYHVKIAKKCVGLQGMDPLFLKKRANKDKCERESSSSPQTINRGSEKLLSYYKERMKFPMKSKGSPYRDSIVASQASRRHSCPKCGKLFGKPSHVKRHLYTCRGPTFQRTSPIKKTSDAYYRQMQLLMNNARMAAAASRNEAEPEDGRIAAPTGVASTSASTATSMEARSFPPRLPIKRKVEKAAKATQSNFLAFAIDSMEDLVSQVPQFLTLEGWTYNLLHDGLAMIQCVLDTDSLECSWNKTVLIRSCLESDDPSTFDVIIKSIVPGYEYMMLEEQTTKLTCIADVFEVMGIPLEEEECEEGEDVSMVMIPSIPAETSHGLPAFRPKREMDHLLTFVRDRAHAPAGSTAALAMTASSLRIGSGGVGLDEGEDELTDDESHSVGEDQEPPDLSALMAARPKGKERVCRVCGVSGFAHRQALYRHIKKTHPHNQCWNCPICREEFTCQNTFMDHYDHHRILGAGEAESRAAVFERLSVEKFMDSIEDEEESNAKRDKPATNPAPVPEGDDENAAEGSASANSKRRKACGDCPPCRITENCEDCTACRTRATSKQKCEKRKCLNMILNKMDDHQQYEVKQLMFSEWALQKPASQPESSSGHPLNEVIKDLKTKLMKTSWRCKLCDLKFPSKDKGVVLSHIATCHTDVKFDLSDVGKLKA